MGMAHGTLRSLQSTRKAAQRVRWDGGCTCLFSSKGGMYLGPNFRDPFRPRYIRTRYDACRSAYMSLHAHARTQTYPLAGARGVRSTASKMSSKGCCPGPRAVGEGQAHVPAVSVRSPSMVAEPGEHFWQLVPPGSYPLPHSHDRSQVPTCIEAAVQDVQHESDRIRPVPSL